VSHNLAPASAPAYPPTLSPSKIQAVGIVIPARNHCETIAKCIHSLFASNSHCGWRQSLWIVVVADACTDDTAKVAREALGAFGQVLEVSARSRQAAHQIGSTTVMEHFRNLPRHTLLLTSTDATAELPRDWINTQLHSSGSPIALPSSH
jgi:Glycosyl transferase family 2